ncbi:patatin-like phospholipase family protein [Herminiimonas fonticola]|uniref:NTE family protein n=1 Tax=Herminiimonas fonticola TaxID=303380 RepID=A0A4R6G1S3_9BURK|nr:patatin-like phospholipase family protein [Herminiimonas fonticola]RBA23585.1 Patatin phospholipase [Herminiimonas fonticola]TDN87465.1 NTE family protein [Herminiimonas fonticola]
MTDPKLKPALHPAKAAMKPTPAKLPGQVVLVMQGGGALGAFQAGVYEAMHEAGIEPDWVVGTSIGAINGAIIAGNAPENRLARLTEFWNIVAKGAAATSCWNAFGLGDLMHKLTTVSQGIPGFFEPNPRSWLGGHTPLGIADASYYSTAPLRRTLGELVDFDHLAKGTTRLALGAVNVCSGRMRYFDSRDDVLGLDHVMASGALPPAFPAVMIDGEPYWDGGIYSNTPIEVVMDDNPRRDSVIFAAQLWQQEDKAPHSINRVMSRYKDIQYASRAESHTMHQQQIHHLRHIVRELGNLLPEKIRATTASQELIDWGCGTVMHVISLQAPALEGEDHTKDIDFTPNGIAQRWNAGRNFARSKIASAPWDQPVDPIQGIVVHD